MQNELLNGFGTHFSLASCLLLPLKWELTALCLVQVDLYLPHSRWWLIILLCSRKWQSVTIFCIKPRFFFLLFLLIVFDTDIHSFSVQSGPRLPYSWARIPFLISSLTLPSVRLEPLPLVLSCTGPKSTSSSLGLPLGTARVSKVSLAPSPDKQYQLFLQKSMVTGC